MKHTKQAFLVTSPKISADNDSIIVIHHENTHFAKQHHKTAWQLRTITVLRCSFAGVRQHITVQQQPNLDVGLLL